MQLARWALLVGLLALVANLSVAEDLESFVNDLEEEDTPAGVDEMDDVSDEERQADELLDDLSENMMKRKGFRFGRSVKAVRNLSRSKSWYLRRAALLARQAHIRRVKRVVKTRKVIKKRSFKKLAKKALKARKNRKARQAKRAAAKARRAKRLAALRAGAKKIAKPRAAVQRLQASAARIRAHLKRVKAAYRKVSAKRRELKKNDAYLLKIAGKFKLKGKKLPSAFAKKMRGIKSQLAALNKARNAIAKRYRVAARALGKANRLLGAAVKRLRKAAKPFQPKVKKVRRRARKVQSKLAKYVKMLRKKGFKWYLGRLKQVMRLHNIQKNNKWKPMLRRLASRIYRVGRLAFGPFGRLGLSKGKLVLRKPLPKKKPAPKKPKKVVKKAKKPTKKAVRKAIRKAKKVLKKAKKPAAKKPSAKKVQAKSAPRVSIDGCFKSCDLLKKQIARDDALREKELKVLKFVRAKMIYLSTLKPEEDISEKEDIEMAQLLEALDITRKHAEIVGHGGVLKLLKQLQDRLNKEHTDAHASLRNRRKGCAAACAAAYKQKKAHKDKALQAKRTMRKRLYGVSKSLNKARGAAKAAAANYASDQKRHVVNNARIKREMGLIGQLTSKLDELEGIKTGELQMSDSDMLTALQEMRETRHDDADVRALLVEMTRASPATARVRVLLRALRAKLIKELSNSQRSLRKRFRAAGHYNRQVKLLKMAQSGARTAHNLARRRLHSARHRLALVVKKCDGNVESE